VLEDTNQQVLFHGDSKLQLLLIQCVVELVEYQVVKDQLLLGSRLPQTLQIEVVFITDKELKTM